MSSVTSTCLNAGRRRIYLDFMHGEFRPLTIFYITCIYVKALGRSFERDIQDHYALRLWLNTEPELLSIARAYRHIEEPSRDARYEGRTFKKEFAVERVVPNFVRVRDHIADLLEKRGATGVPRVNLVAVFQ